MRKIMKKRVTSGIQPSGRLHLGNYLGMVRQAVALQESGQYDCFYFIVDYHSLTQRYQPATKSREIYEMAIDLLAAGLNPKKAAVFIQSHVLEHTNLAWIFNTLTSVGQLERMVEYKEKIQAGQIPNVGLFDYPVLMAADILIYKGELVPVGEDQRQHLELTRRLARVFNQRFGRTFPEPKALLTGASRIMSLTDPRKKMSKSMPAGCLFLSDSPKAIRQKIMAAVTDSWGKISYDPQKRPGISNLVLIYAELAETSVAEVVRQFEASNYLAFKKELAELVIRQFTAFRQKRAALMKERSRVMKLMETGARRARLVAEGTMKEVRRKIGLL
jgi:tryptophanyl-tRNA synthetase